MIYKNNESRREVDAYLLIIIGVLIVFGLICLSSASSVMAYNKFGDAYYYLKRQLVWTFLGGIAFWYFSKIDYHIWKKYAVGFLFFSILLLFLVFIPGLSAGYGTARSWINIFGFSLQPSEFVKLSFLLYLAAWLEARKNDLHNFEMGIGPFVFILGVIAALMVLQPDIGTLSILGATSLIVYFVGGGSTKHILIIIIVAVLGITVLAQFKPYQMDRFRCVFDSAYSANDRCYQVNQSLIAVGSGGIFGRGLGASRQKFMYLPEVYSDSIFAIMAEEVGFVFSTLFIGCFLFLFYKGYKIALKAPDDFGRILAIGIVSWLAVQAFVNIGGIVNIMPMTGVPLPLVSYGGSAILSALAALGILVNISKYTR
ncbi:MAG: putative lipid II flippase FtsW [bacterium]